MISPLGRIKLGLKVALRRRYSYAALRVLRRAAARALADDLHHSIGEDPYTSKARELADTYWRALQRLRRRWPFLDLLDERSLP